MKEFKIYSVETVSEVSQKSNVKIVTYVKRDQKVRRIKKHSRTSPDVQFKEFPLTKQNIAGRLPEKSRNSFVDLQSQKNQ